MTLTNQSLYLYSGDSKRLIVEIKDPHGKPYNLAGCTAKWLLGRSGLSVLSKSSEEGISIQNTTEGRLVINLKPNDTKNLSGDYTHIVKVIDGSGNVYTVLTGTISIHQSML